jgi:hypothetical protein
LSGINNLKFDQVRNVISLQDVWTPQRDNELINDYMELQKLSKVRDRFRVKYLDYQLHFSLEKIEGRFGMLLRQAIRKI